MKHILSLFPIIFSAFTTACGQGNFKEGWLLLNNGDTVHGQLLHKNWNTNPSAVRFRTNQEKTYTIDQAAAFGLKQEKLTYRRFMISRHLAPNNENSYYNNNYDTTVSSTQWLKLLVPGKKSLYYYADADRPYYFFSTGDTAIELVYSTGIKAAAESESGSTRVYTNNGYLGQLTELAGGDDMLVNRALKTTYSENSLADFFERINQTKRNDASKMRMLVSLGGGVVFTRHKAFGVIGNPLYNALLENTTGPFLEAGIELKSTNPLKRFGAHASLRYSQLNTSGTRKIVTTSDSGYIYDIKNNLVELSTGIRYTFNPRSAIRFYMDASVSISKLLKNNNALRRKYYNNTIVDVEKEMSVTDFLIMPFLSAGCRFKQFRVYVHYQPGPDLTRYFSASWSFSRVMAGVSYDLPLGK